MFCLGAIYFPKERRGVGANQGVISTKIFLHADPLSLKPPSLVVKWVKYKLEGVLQWFHHRALVQGLRKAPQLILDIPTIN